MIKIKNLSFSYIEQKDENDNEKSLNDINIVIPKGQVVLFCGESGCGKTTITKLINGLIPHYCGGVIQGEIKVKGEDVSKLPLYDTASFVGSVFQNPRSQFFNVDTTSEIAFGCENMGIAKKEIEQRVQKSAQEMKIEDLMGRSIFALSGGEKQKIACASVATMYPQIMVLDEPSSNLDMESIQDLKDLIKGWKQQEKTVIIAEHRLYYLREVADRVIYLKNGKIMKDYSHDVFFNLSKEQLNHMGLRQSRMRFNQDKHAKNTEKVMHKRIEINQFHFKYKGEKEVLRIDNASVSCGSITAIIGHNGAGKTTFARCLCGLEKKCKGEIILGERVLKSKERLKICYMVMQDVNHQLFTESVMDEVRLSMDNASDMKIIAVLKQLDLVSLKDSHPFSLSGGEKQRVAIASAVASKCEIIILDEPTSGLDYRHMKEVSEVIVKLKQMGKTVFIITHDPEFILTCCSNVFHLEKGKVVEQYQLHEIGRKKLMAFFTGDKI
jgi:energy-coupling factor transport system ATP-binding protein